MEASISREMKVGVFAIVGTVALLASIMLLGGNKMFFSSTYPLRVELADVQGLAKGSVVSLEGVPVGNVSSLTFIPKSSHIEVGVKIYSEFRHRITVGTKATVKTQGALGDKFIYLEAGPLDGQVLANDSMLDTADGSDLFDVLAKRGAEFGQIADVIRELKELFHGMNEGGKTTKLMQNLVSDSEGFKTVMNEARETVTQLRTGPLVHLDSILRKIDRGDGTLGALINDPSIHTRLSQMLGGSVRNKFLTPMIRESIKESER